MIKQLSSRVVYENKWMKVREDDVEFADGKKGIYGVVEKTDGAIIIPLLQKNEYVLVKVYRYTISKWCWEFPCGSTEDSSMNPEEIARTELQEETGYTAKQMIHLGSPHVAYGYTNQVMHVYLAKDLTRGEARLESGETGMEVAVFSIEKIEQMIQSGEITDIESIAAWGMMKIIEL